MARTQARSSVQPRAAPASVISPKIAKTTAKKITKTPLVKSKTRTVATNVKKPKPTSKPSKTEQSPSDRYLAGGPNGPKVYDDLGFELSYAKCAKAMRRGYSRARSDKYMKMLQDSARDNERKREIMGGPAKDQCSAMSSMMWQDRVARELGIPYHKVEMKHYEMLAARGFVGVEGEYNVKNLSKEESDRILKLATGSAFRA